MVRVVFEFSEPIPLLGCIAFGLIDRGTNLIQIRPVTTCPLSCIFCSTDAGPKSKRRRTEYIVPLDYLIGWFKRVAAFKGERNIEAHIDTVGDPLTYPMIVDLVSGLNNVKGVEVISMQTHGSTLTEKILNDLSDAGLTRINLSIDALDPDLARNLSGADWYNPSRIIDLMHHIVSNTKIDLLIAPVWIPGVNDAEIPKIIKLAKEIGAGKRFPPLGIQKYLTHKHGRKVKGIRPISWRKFYGQLKRWEDWFGIKLILSPEDFGIHRRPALSIPYRRSQIIRVKVVGPGWLRGEALAVADKFDRSVTLLNADNIPVGSKVKARILSNKDNIFVAEAII
ncbi:MAG: radical SAM protein [Candidatus Bathyarchaeota archaeon]|nr:radical SAM protein [Candidatus Bathyarchaeota archaeon]